MCVRMCVCVSVIVSADSTMEMTFLPKLTRIEASMCIRFGALTRDGHLIAFIAKMGMGVLLYVGFWCGVIGHSLSVADRTIYLNEYWRHIVSGQMQ